MCGIAGIVDISRRAVDPALVCRMRDAMARRGPDSAGLQFGEGAAFGHRRLSILDLSTAGNQPMRSADGAVWVMLNGEIYNHAALRAELEKRGFVFRSRTDTEVIVNGYMAWGDGLSARCRGMWSFAVWDTMKRRLVLSRDRFGEKPLYFFREGTRLAFASTLAGLAPALPRREIDAGAVASLLSYEYIPTDECIYSGVRKLAPARQLVFDCAGLRETEYWRLDYREKIDISQQEAESRVEELVQAAVAEQLVADVPVGVFLSGGVDSGYITALAAAHRPGISTITMSVPFDPNRDESGNAQLIALLHGTQHIKVPLDHRSIKDLPALLATTEPLGDSSIIATAAVARAAAGQVKVVLTGDGGDECFDGYGKARMAHAAENLAEGWSGGVWRCLAPLLRYLSRQRLTPGARFLRLQASGSRLMAGEGLARYLASWDATPTQVRRILYGPMLRPFADRALGQRLVTALGDGKFNAWWEAVLSVGFRTRLPDDFLPKVDTATMFHSLESRAPFLDHRLVELSARLPWERWMPDGHPKSLLRRLATMHNPWQIVYAPKKGFSLPVEQYFLGPWGRLLMELLEDGAAAQIGLIDPGGVRRYLRLHGLRANQRLDRQLFTLLALEIWLRVFHFKTEAPEELGERLLASTPQTADCIH